MESEMHDNPELWFEFLAMTGNLVDSDSDNSDDSDSESSQSENSNN